MKLYAVMYDTLRTRMAIVHENSYLPYRRRLVEVPLTPEQEELLAPRQVGFENGEPVFEERGETWLEDGDTR